MATTAALSLPATVQHFVVWRDPARLLSAPGKPWGRQLLTYDPHTLAAMDFLQKDAHPGDVVLCEDNAECTCPRADEMPGAARLFFFWFGCAKRLHKAGRPPKRNFGTTGD